MADEPDNITHHYLRRFDAQLERIADQQGDIGRRMTGIEIQIGHVASNQATHYANTMLRLDGMERRLDRIERRLNLVEGSPDRPPDTIEGR